MFTKQVRYHIPLVALALLLAAPFAQASEKLDGSSAGPAVSDQPAPPTGTLYRVRVSSLHPGWAHEILPFEKVSHGATRKVPLARAVSGSYTDQSEWASPLVVFRVLGSEEEDNNLRPVKHQGAVEVSFQP